MTFDRLSIPQRLPDPKPAWRQFWAARKDNGDGRIFFHFGDYFIVGHHFSFFVLCVAKVTFQVAAGKTDEDGRSSGMVAFTLQAVKDFINL